jgi:predicted RNA polymerase sigma factor
MVIVMSSPNVDLALIVVTDLLAGSLTRADLMHRGSVLRRLVRSNKRPYQVRIGIFIPRRQETCRNTERRVIIEAQC